MNIVVAGALGEVGSSLVSSLRLLGHEVTRATSRALLSDGEDLTHLSALDLSGCDLLINAGGRGDLRPGTRTGLEATRSLVSKCEASGVRGILISTTRVLEGATGPINCDGPAFPITDYAKANAALEEAWLVGKGLQVLRLSNLLILPQRQGSPQSRLLPWSLVREALGTGHIHIRSSPDTTRDFVTCQDVVSAVSMMATEDASPRVTSSIPGTRISIGEMVSSVIAAFERQSREIPSASFGTTRGMQPMIMPGWLSQRGWVSEVTLEALTDSVTAWLAAFYPK